MSDQEELLLNALGISKAEVAKALDITRQAVVRGIAAVKGGYLTAERLILVSEYLRKKSEDLDRRFQQEAIRHLGLRAETAFGRPNVDIRYDTIDLEVQGRKWPDKKEALDLEFEAANEVWFFAPRPRELERDGYLDLMASYWFRRSKNTRKLIRFVYFTTPDLAPSLAVQFLMRFQNISVSDRMPVFVYESDALSISPRFIIINPLPDTAVGWVVGQEEHQLIRMIPSTTRRIVEAISRAGLIGMMDFFPETFGAGTEDLPRFKLRFRSWDLARSAELLGQRLGPEPTIPTLRQRPDANAAPYGRQGPARSVAADNLTFQITASGQSLRDREPDRGSVAMAPTQKNIEPRQTSRIDIKRILGGLNTADPMEIPFAVLAGGETSVSPPLSSKKLENVDRRGTQNELTSRVLSIELLRSKLGHTTFPWMKGLLLEVASSAEDPSPKILVTAMDADETEISDECVVCVADPEMHIQYAVVSARWPSAFLKGDPLTGPPEHWRCWFARRVAEAHDNSVP